MKREGGKAARVFSTQQEARKRQSHSKRGKLRAISDGRNGQIREYATYGMPPIQHPPGKKSTKIEKAAGKITLDRLAKKQQLESQHSGYRKTTWIGCAAGSEGGRNGTEIVRIFPTMSLNSLMSS